MIQRCYLQKFQGIFLCSDAQMNIYFTKFQSSMDMAHMYHQNLYLGKDKLQKFADPSLLVSWVGLCSAAKRREDLLL